MTFDLLTESRCQCVRRCFREEHLRYVLGIVPTATADALRFGTLCHYCLEAWWICSGDDFALKSAIAAMHKHASPDSDVFELARLQAMMEGYHARWAGERYEVIGVEVEFRAPIINPETDAASRSFQRAGKIDAIVKDATGRVLIVEHKTSSEDIGPGSSYWARLRMGGQSSMYLRGAEALGHSADGVMYDVLRKPQLKPLQANTRRATPENVDEYLDRVREAIAEDPDRYYQRGLVVRLEKQMAEADGELWQLTQTLRSHHRLQLAPRNTDACSRYGNTCSYFGVCCGEESIEDSKFKRLDWPHPELTPQ